MSEPVFDIVENIIERLDVEDLIRCKSVCKSWLSFISSSRFVNTHREYNHNKDHNNRELGHRRIIMSTYSNTLDDNGKVLDFAEYWYDAWCIVGSCNGLVCFSASFSNAQVIVTNPLTREVKKLPTACKVPDRSSLCWGFGYDSFTDDYKVVMGKRMTKTRTLFHVLTLKSNLWRVRQVKWGTSCHPLGILWNGALHWFMKDLNSNKVIISFDLSREEFKEFPQPDDTRYVCSSSNSLGIAEGCLCIYSNYHPPYQRWVVKSNNDKQSWELLRDDCVMNTYDIAHALINKNNPHNNWYLSSYEDDKFFSKIGKYIRCPIYVQSLVSPHLNEKPKKKRQTKNKKAGVLIKKQFLIRILILRRGKMNGKIRSNKYVVI